MATVSRGGLCAGLVCALTILASHSVHAIVKSFQKISDTQGGFTYPLDDDDRFGSAVESLGDLDGDGVDDIAVGAYLDQFYGDRPGAIYTLLLNADGTVKSHVRITEGEGGFTGQLDFWDEFGISIRNIGDLDNDGVVDIAVGARGDDDGPSFGADGFNVGAVWILFLHANGTVKSHQKISARAGNFSGDLDDEDWFGHPLTNLGDVSGDGVVDIGVAAARDDDGGTDRGAIWILHLAVNGTVKSQQKISDTAGGFTGELSDGDFFGSGLGSFGDLDGDGVVDLAIGAAFDDDGGFDRGAVWIVFRNPDGSVKSHQKISDTQGGFDGVLDNEDHFGVSLNSMGTGCNRQQVLTVGATTDDDGGFDRGAVWLLSLNTNGTVDGHAKISSTAEGFTGNLSNEDLFGLGVAPLGDFDGDGIQDLVVGARMDDDGGENHGAVYMLFLDELFLVDACSIQPSSIDLGTVQVNQSVDGAFTITNTGCTVLTGAVTESCPMYSILTNGGPYALSPGDSMAVTFRFSPTITGNHSCTIQTGNLTCGDVFVTGFAEDESAMPPEPNILSILDVGNDQGRNVRIRFERSERDELDSPTPILQYEIFRRIDPLPSAASQSDPALNSPIEMVSDRGVLLDGWDFVGSLPAHGEDIYNIISPTLADSTLRDGMHWSVFFVRAATAQPLVFFDSPPDSGYSLDNRPPTPPPSFLVAHLQGQGNLLDWTASVDADVYDYRIYRDTSENFQPSPENLLHVTAATDWFDDVANGWQYRYLVTAVDVSGNESAPTEPAITTDVDHRIPTQSGLHQNVPNPFNPSTTIAYDVAAPGGRVTLEIFDVRGQRIRTLVDEEQAPGVKSKHWDGRDQGGQSVASGVYFCRLRVGVEGFTRKMTVMK